MAEVYFDIKVKNEEYRCIFVEEEESCRSILAELGKRTDELFGLDTETAALERYRSYPKAALNPHTSSIRLLQIFDGKNVIVFDLWKLKPELFIPFLEAGRFIGHNSVFDLQFLFKMGVKQINMGCTLLLAKLLIHATKPVDIRKSLAVLTEEVLDIKVLKKVQDSDWGNEELTHEQIEYAALDPIYTLLIADALAPGLEKYGMSRVYQLHKNAQYAIAKMQLNGLSLDKELHKANIAKWREDHHHAKMEVLAFTGLSKLTSHTLAQHLEENLDEDTLAIWPRTPGGKLKTDAHVFSDFSYLEIADKYNEYQKLDKLISSFGDGLLGQINPETKRIHAGFKIGEARTGRMSCSEPNLQQLPRDKAVRNIFVPSKPGNVFVCADFSMIELRCAAEISRDEVMLQAFRDGVDLHKLTASKILGKRINDVTDEDRQMAKAFNFGLLFGLGSAKFSHYAKKSYKVDVSQDEAVRSIEIFRDTYAGYREWQIAQGKKCEVDLRASTICGKLQRLTEDNYYGTGLNHPIQGTAAEILLYSLVFLNTARQDYDFDIVNTVHDEITLECHPDIVEPTKIALEMCMTRGFVEVFPNGCTRDLVKAKVGKSWGSAK